MISTVKMEMINNNAGILSYRLQLDFEAKSLYRTHLCALIIEVGSLC